jgi:hypothetical protein
VHARCHHATRGICCRRCAARDSLAENLYRAARRVVEDFNAPLNGSMPRGAAPPMRIQAMSHSRRRGALLLVPLVLWPGERSGPGKNVTTKLTWTM